MSNMNKHASKHTAAIQASLKKRYARERRFQWYGRLAVFVGFVFLFILLADIVSKGSPAFTQHYIKLDITLDEGTLGVGPGASPEELFSADYLGVIKASLREMFPDVTGRKDKRQLYRLVSMGAEYDLRDRGAGESANDRAYQCYVVACALGSRQLPQGADQTCDPGDGSQIKRSADSMA